MKFPCFALHIHRQSDWWLSHIWLMLKITNHLFYLQRVYRSIAFKKVPANVAIRIFEFVSAIIGFVWICFHFLSLLLEWTISKWMQRKECKYRVQIASSCKINKSIRYAANQSISMWKRKHFECFVISYKKLCINPIKST